MSDDKYEGLGLSDEEIAAMEAELSDDEQALADAAKGVTADEDEDDNDDDVAAGAESSDALAEVTPVESATQEKTVEPSNTMAEIPPDQPIQQQSPSKLDTLKSELADIKKQFDEGDLSIDEYVEKRATVDREIAKAELKAELASDEVARTWQKSQSEFLGQNSYLRDNDIVYDAFAMQVNKILADPKSTSMSDAAILSAAKQKVDAAFNIKSEPSAKPGESQIRDAKREAADRGKTPRTLRDVPASATADDVDASPFAYLDRLKGDELEAALMKLSDDDQRRYAHSQ